MDLKNNIQQELWDAIEKNYSNDSYSSAILDAIHLLTETIRNKTGLEGDGSSLIGQAFGGSSPMIRLNKLQTESEKNVQKGMVDLLRGVYTTIRNPRSHDKHSDSKRDADIIILFLDYLLNLIDKSKVQFEASTFLKRVYDQYYLCTYEYSKMLADEVPKRYRLNIAVEIIRNRKQDNEIRMNLFHFVHALLEIMEENEIKELYNVISEELKYTTDVTDIQTILFILPPKYWSMMNEAVKLRTENVLFESVKSGYYSIEEDECRRGGLGTWIQSEHFYQFGDTDRWTEMIVEKLQSGEEGGIAYVEKYFWDRVCKVNREEIDSTLLVYFYDGMFDNDSVIIQKLKEQIQSDENHPWWEVFEEELKEYPEILLVKSPF
ncbi:TIGR02391 family protein [Paenibacillus polymyxa]|uniref:TIGR02391 family protein n=1 Tax=Paenibacillus polymyxa TaxID=1406 RepID=UPI001BEC3E80|nr:TIGR02391 family protein [Paenibacillus polymyxa]MBT2285169.1 TIGR02391 family protein [Paenibacillus polymyxa]